MSEIAQTKVLPQVHTNPLLKPWETPHQTPPFDDIKPEHFLPAFEQAFTDHTAEITAITHDPATPDFDNTITALERSGKLLNKVSAVFYDLVSAHSNPEILDIDKEVSLRMARHWNPIMMNGVLFGRIALLHDNRASLKLTGEQLRLLERTYTRFHRSGAGLNEDDKKRMAEINERLAQLGTTFSHHLLADEQDWVLELTEADLTVVTKTQPTATQVADMLFAFTIARHVKSNAIVFAKDGQTAGIGAGQMNRRDSARIAAIRAAEAAELAGLPASLAEGSACASDAFFPFADGLIQAVEAGARAIIQPGGSIGDAKVIEAADEAGLAMVFTGVRVFRH